MSAIQVRFATALLDSRAAVPASIGEGSHPSRFDVYRNNVHAGLGRALARRFPVTERLVGAQFFAQMAGAYVREHKPDSPVMITYGDTFGTFVDTYDLAADVPYLADIARLEADWTSAYHAEDREALGVTDLAAIDPQLLPAMRVHFHPAARIIPSRFPIGSIWAAHQTEPVGTIQRWAAETLLIARPAFDVGVHIIPAPDVVFAQALAAGHALETSAEAAAKSDPAFDFGQALVGLTSLGAFCALSPLENPS